MTPRESGLDYMRELASQLPGLREALRYHEQEALYWSHTRHPEAGLILAMHEACIAVFKGRIAGAEMVAKHLPDEAKP